MGATVLSWRKFIGYFLCLPAVALRLAVARRRARRSLEIAEFGMAVATVGDKEGDQIAHTLDIGAIDYRTPLPRASHKARARQNGEVRRQRVVRRADNVRDSAGGKAFVLPSNEKPEDLEPRRLAERRQGRQRMRRRHFFPV